MKKLKIVLVLIVVIFSNSCEKFDFLDDELTLDKMPYTGNQLRIDGYYHYYSQYADIYRILFLYRDGTILNGGHVFADELIEQEQKYRDGSFFASKKDNKRYWGVFNINSDIIQIEMWYASSGAGMPVYLHSGEITNDTTFVITKSIRPKTGKEKELNEVYHFKYLTPKPDSTNSFVK